MARRKTDGIGDRTDAMERMVELAAEATRLQTAVAKRDEEIAQILGAYSEEIDTTAKRVSGLKAELKVWAAANEKFEAVKDTRTIRFEGVGEIALRTNGPEVKLGRGVTEDAAIQRLFDAGLGGLVRTVQELNREEIIASRDAMDFGRVEACGIAVRQTENVLFNIDGVGKV